MSLHHELMDLRVLRDLRTGVAAMSSDGKKLGTVDGVEGKYIKVRVPLGRDYWLKADYVTEETPDRVTFSFARRDLGAYRVYSPSQEDPLAERQDAVISDKEQVEQRARMERELEEQRQRARRAG
jgi:hypothetical protein